MSRATEMRKKEQLGMPFGTAGGRLRKMILFSMAQQLRLDKCCRCGEFIDNADELTIEHIKPWLDVDPKLFWDLKNVGFSHSGCNRPHRARGNPSGPKPKSSHACGTWSAYRKGCRCKKCKAWKKKHDVKYQHRMVS